MQHRGRRHVGLEWPLGRGRSPDRAQSLDLGAAVTRLRYAVLSATKGSVNMPGDVCFEPHSGLKSDIAALPKRAQLLTYGGSPHPLPPPHAGAANVLWTELMARFGVAVCVKLLSEQLGYRDKTLNGR